MSEIKSVDITMVSVSELVPHPKNMHDHPAEQIDRLCKIIEYQGFRTPLTVQKGTNLIVTGHGRLMAAKQLGMADVPVSYQEFDSDEQIYAHIVADNAIGKDTWATLDLSQINTDIIEFGPELDIDMLGLKDFTIEPLDSISDEDMSGNMITKFGIPPFSVFDTRQGYWQERVKTWKEFGIQSELGREVNTLAKTESILSSINSGTSVFDPCLTEICYKWFSPGGGIILDPFAGGSVRGIVAGLTGRQYIGNDLRKEQIVENIKQADSICADAEFMPVWHCGDSLDIDKICKDVEADFIFSCPPYADLEVYSEDERDISNMSYDEFKSVYFDIIKKSCSLLKENSFACFVVGEVRDKKGNYYNFVGDTIDAFKKAGLEYYNEIVLVNSAGTLPLRAGKFLKASRKIGKMHQNVLVFVKGDAKEATAKLGEIVIDNIED